jgi:hypothetical protein
MLYVVDQLIPQEQSILFMEPHKDKGLCIVKFITLKTDVLFSMQMEHMSVALDMKNLVMVV